MMQLKEEIKKYFYHYIEQELQSILEALERGRNGTESLWFKFIQKLPAFTYSEILSYEQLFYLTLTSTLESKLGNALNNVIIRLILDNKIAQSIGWMPFESLRERLKKIDIDVYVRKSKDGKQTGFQIRLHDVDFKLELKKSVEGEKIKVDKKYIKTLLEELEALEAKEEKKYLKFDLDLILGHIEANTIFVDLHEIKTGGVLDSSKAPADLSKIIKPYIYILRRVLRLPIQPNFFFSTLYNSKVGGVQSYLNHDNILVGEAFWDYFFKKQLSYKDVKDIYRQVATNLRFTERIEELKELTLRAFSQYRHVFSYGGTPNLELKREYKKATGQKYVKADHFKFLRWLLHNRSGLFS